MRRLVPLLVCCATLAVGAGCARTAGSDAVPAAATNWGDPSAPVPASPTTDSPSPVPTAAASTSPPAAPKPQPTTAAPTPTGGSAAGPAQQLLAQVNQLRAANGLRPYTLSTRLIASAHQHNLVMSGGCGLSHQCPNEADLGARITAQGASWRSCGENIGESGPAANTAAALLAAAKGLTTAMYNEKAPDDGHRRNLLSTGFTQIGIDVVRDAKGTVWLTQDFAG
jgi:uncharacterized protein YkwD